MRDELADGRLWRHRLEVGPARFGRHPEDVDGAVFIRVFRIGALLALRVQLRAFRLEGIGDVFQEDETEDDVLVLGGVHVIAQGTKVAYERSFKEVASQKDMSSQGYRDRKK